MKIISSILFVLLGVEASAQQFYITRYNSTTYLNTICSVDADLNVTPLASFYFNGDQIWDIAFGPDGELYGATTYALIEMNLQNSTYTTLYEFPVPGQYNSLVCNSDRQILALEYHTNHLVTIDLTTLTEVSDVVLSESTPGDLTFYKGNLIFQGTTSNNILSYDGTTVRTVACAIPRPSGENFLFYGLSNYTDPCENNFVCGISEDGHFYRFDVEAHTSTDLGAIAYNPEPINGSATVNEYTASACAFLNLNEIDCTVKVEEEQLSDPFLYPNPTTDVLHIQGLDMHTGLFFTIHSLDGRKLIEGALTPDIDLSTFPSGMYLLHIYNRSKTLSTTKRIVKNRSI